MGGIIVMRSSHPTLLFAVCYSSACANHPWITLDGFSPGPLKGPAWQHFCLRYTGSPMKFRVQFINMVITFGALHSQMPSFISELLQPNIMSRSLASPDQCLLAVPRSRLKTKGMGGDFLKNAWLNQLIHVNFCISWYHHICDFLHDCMKFPTSPNSIIKTNVRLAPVSSSFYCCFNATKSLWKTMSKTKRSQADCTQAQ